MADTSGAVPRANVIAVLSSVAPGLNVSIKIDDGHEITLVKDGSPEVIVLPELVPRRMLQRFQGKYGVKIEFFYHPEMCCHGTSGRSQ